jgi:FKBP-type peptidyl-prolyl cis-trans isomerase
MKKMILPAILLVALLSAFVGCKGGRPDTLCVKRDVVLKTERDSFSYVFGRDIARQLQMFGGEVNTDVLFSAILEGLDTTSVSQFDEMTERQIISKVMTRLREEAMAEMRKEAEGNKTAGEDFLTKNKERAEVTVTESGLQYEVLTEGDATGAKPTDGSVVEVRYVGTFIDGAEFDKTPDTLTARFPVSGVIRGWTEGLQLMNVGAKYKFFIPPDLAYGEGGRPGVPPNSVLVFEVELVSFE